MGTAWADTGVQGSRPKPREKLLRKKIICRIKLQKVTKNFQMNSIVSANPLKQSQLLKALTQTSSKHTHTAAEQTIKIVLKFYGHLFFF